MAVYGLAITMLVGGLGATPQAALDIALADAEPPPAMRAAFRATISSASGSRQIEYDPLKAPSDRFKLVASQGADPELDAIVTDWAREPSPDVRLYADDLRNSLGEGEITRDGAGLRVVFQHRLSANDGPMDAVVSQRMEGGLTLDPETGRLTRLEYWIRQPFQTPDGSTVDRYNQVYSFGRSERWGVTFVTGYDLKVTGGRFGLQESRSISVKVTDVAFTLVSEARMDMESKPWTPPSRGWELARADGY